MQASKDHLALCDFPPPPAGWEWQVTRVIHCLPDDQCDGWKVVLYRSRYASVEVLHRNRDHARAIALEAAGEVYPDEFPQYATVKKGPR